MLLLELENSLTSTVTAITAKITIKLPTQESQAKLFSLTICLGRLQQPTAKQQTRSLSFSLWEFLA
jgi:hypothetical protein